MRWRADTAREEAREAFAAAREAGFDDVSIDLIYGIPGQSAGDWAAGLRGRDRPRPDHLSCYALQLALAPDEWAAPPRPGALRWRERMAARQDDGLAAEQYRLAEALLEAAGYRHYELSSWALPGHESRHNAAYWSRRAYTGVGAGAHSFDGVDERSWNARDLDEYLADVRGGPKAGGGCRAARRGGRAPSRRWPSACGGSTESSAGRSPPSSEPIRWIALPAAWPMAVRAS